jgi:hypothetical protein
MTVRAVVAAREVLKEVHDNALEERLWKWVLAGELACFLDDGMVHQVNLELARSGMPYRLHRETPE